MRRGQAERPRRVRPVPVGAHHARPIGQTAGGCRCPAAASVPAPRARRPTPTPVSRTTQSTSCMPERSTVSSMKPVAGRRDQRAERVGGDVAGRIHAADHAGAERQIGLAFVDHAHAEAHGLAVAGAGDHRQAGGKAGQPCSLSARPVRRPSPGATSSGNCASLQPDCVGEPGMPFVRRGGEQAQRIRARRAGHQAAGQPMDQEAVDIDQRRGSPQAPPGGARQARPRHRAPASDRAACRSSRGSSRGRTSPTAAPPAARARSSSHRIAGISGAPSGIDQGEALTLVGDGQRSDARAAHLACHPGQRADQRLPPVLGILLEMPGQGRGQRIGGARLEQLAPGLVEGDRLDRRRRGIDADDHVLHGGGRRRSGCGGEEAAVRLDRAGGGSG